MIQRSTDLGGEVTPVFVYVSCDAAGAEPLILTDAAAEDGTKVTSASIDRMGYDSAVLVVPAFAHLANTKTLTFAVGILESDDDSAWAAEEVLQAATTLLTGDVGHAKKTGILHLDINLRTRKRYFRITLTPATNSAGDTANFAAAVLLGGKSSLPAT